MRQEILEKKLNEIKICVDQLTDADVKKFVERYPLLKKYYSKLNAIEGDCKKCGFCCIGGISLSGIEIDAILMFIPEFDYLIETFTRKNLTTGEVIKYLVTKCTKYGYCIFNTDEGTCIIHKIRPILCRVFPFFPKEKGTCAKNVTFTGLSVDEGKEIWTAHFLEIKNQQKIHHSLDLHYPDHRSSSAIIQAK